MASMPAFSRKIMMLVLSALSKCRNSASEDTDKVASRLTRCRHVPLANVSINGVPPMPGRSLRRWNVRTSDGIARRSAVDPAADRGRIEESRGAR